jgi:hypothetical protein
MPISPSLGEDGVEFSKRKAPINGGNEEFDFTSILPRRVNDGSAIRTNHEAMTGALIGERTANSEWSSSALKGDTIDVINAGGIL